ncbi:MAG TPA: hypothetical protein VEQ60_24560 [Longimicrobium sp.]|nr:hypothetical protein [Longimicrobium sp.]
MLTMRLRGIGLGAVLSLALVPGPAVAARVPQPRELDAALRQLSLPRDTDTVRISHDRFPLYFPVDRHHGQWRSPDNSLMLSIHGHGHSARRYQSVSLEMLVWHSGDFEAGVAHTERVITTIGLPDEVRAAAAEMIRTTHAQRQTERTTGRTWYMTVTRETREVAGIQIRMRFESLSHVFLQFTDADAPEARWPSRDEVEQVHPHSHRRVLDIPADVGVFQDPVVLSLRCRPAGRGALRCRYVLQEARLEGGRAVDAAFTGLFRKNENGRWSVQLDQPPLYETVDPQPPILWERRPGS